MNDFHYYFIFSPLILNFIMKSKRFFSYFLALSITLLAFSACVKEEVNVSLDGAYKGTWILKGVSAPNTIANIGSSKITTPVGSFSLNSESLGTTQSTASISLASGSVTVTAAGNCTFSGTNFFDPFSFSGTRQ
jgi:hypothetical protein